MNSKLPVSRDVQGSEVNFILVCDPVHKLVPVLKSCKSISFAQMSCDYCDIIARHKSLTLQLTSNIISSEHCTINHAGGTANLSIFKTETFSSDFNISTIGADFGVVR